MVSGMILESCYTIFLDIDGTIMPQGNTFDESFMYATTLPGTSEKLLEWHKKGYKIILTTGRPSAYRQRTEEQLLSLNIIYDQLIMDCGCGPRVVVNDKNPLFPDKPKARGINLNRNEGISKVQLD